MGRGKKILGVMGINNSGHAMDDYIWSLLDFLKEYTENLILICQKDAGSECQRLLSYTDMIYGCHMGPPEHKVSREDYDALWLLDDKFFGPFFSAEGLVSELETYQHGFVAVIQSHFMVINDPDKVSQRDWEHILDEEKEIMDVVGCIAAQGEVVVDLEKFKDKGRPFLPFLEKDTFLRIDLNSSSGEIPSKNLEYLDKHTEYQTDMIWQHLLRTCHIQDIKNALHLEYIFDGSSDHFEMPLDSINRLASHKTALIVHLHYEDMVEECFVYLEHVPEFIDLYITTGNPATWQMLCCERNKWGRENCFVRWKENRGRDISSLLVACHDILMNYEILGFIHDKKSEHSLGTEMVSGSFQYNIWENLLKNEGYILQILECLQKKPKLGLLVPPEPYYASLLGCLGDAWGNCFEPTKRLASCLGLNVLLEENKMPFTLSTTFWCKTDAMKSLFTYKFQYHDFPEEPMAADGTISHGVERILAYAAQSEGYYTAIAMNDGYASLRGNCLQMLLADALGEMRKEAVILNPRDICGFWEKSERLLAFCKQYPRIYIYGVGTYGCRCIRILRRAGLKIAGFLVSDGYKSQHEAEGECVYELSELDGLEQTRESWSVGECGIILALNVGNQKAVIPLLEEKGYRNRFSILE